MQARPHYALIFAAFVVAAACKQNAPITHEGSTTGSKATKPMDEKQADVVAQLDWARKPCDEPGELSDLDELTVDAVEARLGPPSAQESFRMAERQDEFHIELQNTYPLSEAGNEKVEIQEWTWHAEDCRLTVWFHRVNGQWQAFQNRRWDRTTDY